MIRNLVQMMLVGGVMVNPPAFFDWLYRRPWYGEMLRQWAFDLPDGPDGAGARVLELGCGPGGLTRDMTLQGWQVTGVDQSPAMIKKAQGIGGPSFVQADALNLPFAEGEFDVVLSASLVNLVPDRVALFASMARVLRPGGVASVLFPTPDFTPDRAKVQADRLPILSGAALQLWSGKAPQCDPKKVMQEAAAAGLVRGVCTQTGVDGVVAVTAWAA